MRVILPWSLLLILSLIPAPLRAENVEHPNYRSWARYPAGTSVTIRSLTRSPQSKITTTTTYTLVELLPDRAVIEVRKVSDATGTTVEVRPETMVEKRFFPLFPGVKKEDVGNPEKPKAQGEETLTLAGRTIKTRWYETKGALDAGPTENRIWLSDEIPGRMVKTVLEVPSASTTITLELVDMTVP